MLRILDKVRLYVNVVGSKTQSAVRFTNNLKQKRRCDDNSRREKIAKFLEATRTQCNVYVAQRFRRLHRIYLLYQRAYNGCAKFFLFSPILKRYATTRPLAFTLAACGFQWKEGFSDDDLQEQVDELLMVQSAMETKAGVLCCKLPNWWENVLDEPHIKMWRYPSGASGVMAYKVHGTFTDVSPKMFFNIQLDSEYRKKWDDLVIKLDLVDENPSKNEQVLQWVTRMPFPMAHREYLFIRRNWIDEKNNIMVISSKAVRHPSCQQSEKYVRVSSYISHMLIKPHKTYDDLGFDFLMTYCDDPEIVLPNGFASWVVSAGIPEYIKKVHDACLNFYNTDETSECDTPSFLLN